MRENCTSGLMREGRVIPVLYSTHRTHRTTSNHDPIEPPSNHVQRLAVHLVDLIELFEGGEIEDHFVSLRLKYKKELQV